MSFSPIFGCAVFSHSTAGKNPACVSNSKAIAATHGNAVRVAFVQFLNFFGTSDLQKGFRFFRISFLGGLILTPPATLGGRVALASRQGRSWRLSRLKILRAHPLQLKIFSLARTVFLLLKGKLTLRRSGRGTQVKQHDTSPCGRSRGKR